MVMIGEKPWVKFEEISDTEGKFIVEPLERGYGSTLGNSLRRVLLSSLPGAAITSISIEGVPHEFSTISAVTEDVLEIMLNLKEIVVKSHSDSPKVMKLSAKGKGDVVAGDIEHDAEIEIINKDKKIATLDAKGKLNMEMTVERGKGYVPAVRNKKGGLAAGTIPVDSIFTPVLKVNITIEEVRVGQEINYDKLILHVWTDGSIGPEAAMKESAKILARHVDMFVHLGQKSEVLGIPIKGAEEKGESAMDMTIEDLELSARSYNCLKSANIKTVREVVKYSEEDLMNLKNFGLKSLNEIREKLSEYKINIPSSEESGAKE
ncbi:MAG: DNA-directed RNA polymerase subunit alpha [Candidatus Margulisbacteria bacterium]|nr:DNA-directed RNA polymerase subunit alpha [Candidatus Margulisiibacteriota bacterium]MBU1022080.1 DNA-directed RNA polymerase subunit alpha [Candidatus Margulisiibacteriota bacterium]MBU1729675.1 DNA-directed RNA polymerase subunit alpha [Candidatus Margulisiibacteriota bacterium]MBU1954995.1 DNA-directed RNA polymerase subunit alpha [Candidatus Margulisiibacteriota bacterium]